MLLAGCFKINYLPHQAFLNQNNKSNPLACIQVINCLFLFIIMSLVFSAFSNSNQRKKIGKYNFVKKMDTNKL